MLSSRGTVSLQICSERACPESTGLRWNVWENSTPTRQVDLIDRERAALKLDWATLKTTVSKHAHNVKLGVLKTT
jgi:hypothetical protein